MIITLSCPLHCRCCVHLVSVSHVLQPTKYLDILGMSSLAELEAHQAEKSRLLRVGGSPRRRPARPGSAGRTHGSSVTANGNGGVSPTSPAESPLSPDMTLSASGLRRASTPGPHSDRRYSIPEAIRHIPGAVALAEGTYVSSGRVSSASSAVQGRRRSVQLALATVSDGSAAALDDSEGGRSRRSAGSAAATGSGAPGADLAAMLGPPTGGPTEMDLDGLDGDTEPAL